MQTPFDNSRKSYTTRIFDTRRKYVRGTIGVNAARGVNSQSSPKNGWLILAGIFIGMLLPLLMDMALFGTPFPCHTTQGFADGSSIQKCSVRN